MRKLWGGTSIRCQAVLHGTICTSLYFVIVCKSIICWYIGEDVQLFILLLLQKFWGIRLFFMGYARSRIAILRVEPATPATSNQIVGPLVLLQVLIDLHILWPIFFVNNILLTCLHIHILFYTRECGHIFRRVDQRDWGRKESWCCLQRLTSRSSGLQVHFLYVWSVQKYHCNLFQLSFKPTSLNLAHQVASPSLVDKSSLQVLIFYKDELDRVRLISSSGSHIYFVVFGHPTNLLWSGQVASSRMRYAPIWSAPIRTTTVWYKLDFSWHRSAWMCHHILLVDALCPSGPFLGATTMKCGDGTRKSRMWENDIDAVVPFYMIYQHPSMIKSVNISGFYPVIHDIVCYTPCFISTIFFYYFCWNITFDLFRKCFLCRYPHSFLDDDQTKHSMAGHTKIDHMVMEQLQRLQLVTFLACRVRRFYTVL